MPRAAAVSIPSTLPGRGRPARAGAVAALALACAGAAAAQSSCQEVLPPEADWVFGTSDEARGYLRAEAFQAGGPVTSITVSLLQMRHDEEPWSPCVETFPQVRVRLYEDAGGMPGRPLLSEYRTQPMLPAGVLYGGVAPLATLVLDVDPALGLDRGWIALAGRGQPDCLLLWGGAAGGDGLSLLDRGQGWEYVDYDLALCVAWQPLDAPVLSLTTVAEGARLDWPPVPGAARYQVWRRLGEGAFLPLGDPLAGPGYLDLEAPLLERAQYRVTALLP